VSLLAADWVTISALATAGGTLVLALATFASVRSLLAGLRPVLMQSRPDDPAQKVGFADERWFHVAGSGGVAEAADDALYLAIALRNAGSGIAAVARRWNIDRPDPR
jgi:hypothetical protein